MKLIFSYYFIIGAIVTFQVSSLSCGIQNSKQIKHQGNILCVPDFPENENQSCEIILKNHKLSLSMPQQFCAQKNDEQKCVYDSECKSLKCVSTKCQAEKRILRGGRGGSTSGRSSSSSFSRYSYSYSSSAFAYTTYGSYYGLYLDPYYGQYYYVAGYTNVNNNGSGVIIPAILVPLFIIAFIIAGYCIYKIRQREAAQIALQASQILEQQQNMQIEASVNFGVEQVGGLNPTPPQAYTQIDQPLQTFPYQQQINYTVTQPSIGMQPQYIPQQYAVPQNMPYGYPVNYAPVMEEQQQYTQQVEKVTEAPMLTDTDLIPETQQKDKEKNMEQQIKNDKQEW